MSASKLIVVVLVVVVVALLILTLVSATGDDIPSVKEYRQRRLQNGVVDDDEAQSRIVGGDTAPSDRYPYVVSIQVLATQEAICGGALVAPDVVVTAPQCVEQVGDGVVENIVALVGAYDIFNPLPDAQYFAIDGVVYGGAEPTGRVALLKLNGTATQQWAIMNSDDTFSLNFLPLTTMGWGQTSFIANFPPNGLQEVTVIAITDGICLQLTQQGGLQSYEEFVLDETVCAVNELKGTCTGDIGGPLVLRTGNGPGQDILVGTSTFSFLCAQVEYPTVYARTSSNYPFVRSFICAHSALAPAYLGCEEGTFSPAPTLTPGITLAPTPVPTVATNSPSVVVGPGTVTVFLQLDKRPVDTLWGIRRKSDLLPIITVPAGTYGPFDTTITTTVNLEPGEQYEFFVLDVAQNGICCDAYAAVYLGDTVAEDQVLAFVEAGVFRRSAVRTFAVDPANVFRATFSPTFSPSSSPAPSASQVPTVTQSNVTVALFLDDKPYETGFAIVDLLTGFAVALVDASEFQTFEAETLVNRTYSLDAGQTYAFIVFDVGADGQFAGEDGQGFAAVYLGNEIRDDRLLAFLSGDIVMFAEANFTVSEDAFVTLSPTTSPTPFETAIVTVVINFDLIPIHTGWSIGSTLDRQPFFDVPIGTYGFDFQSGTVSQKVELPVNREYILLLLDQGGNGLCCDFGQGNVTIYLGEDPFSDDAMVLAFNNGEFQFNSGTTFFVPDLNNPPSAAPVIPPISTFPPCSICGEGLIVSMPNVTLELAPGFSALCGEWEAAGLQGFFAPVDCEQLPNLVGVCGCEPGDITPATSAPVASFPPCSVCGEGQSVTNPNALASLAPGQDVPCGVVELAGLQGAIDPSTCLIIGETLGPCGCAPDSPGPVTMAPATPAPITPIPTAAPVTPVPTTLAPVTPVPTTPAPVTPLPTTLAPVTPAPTMNPVQQYPSCSICGLGSRVTDLDAVLLFAQGPISCADAEVEGFEGRIHPTTCARMVATGIRRICGCTKGPMAQRTPYPTPLRISFPGAPSLTPLNTPNPTKNKKRKGKKKKKTKGKSS